MAAASPTTFTFVNTHLAAFDEMTDKRDSDFHELSKRLLFERPISAQAPPPPPGSGSDDDEIHLSLGDAEMFGFDVNAPLSIYETDALFWLVSLNSWVIPFFSFFLFV